MKMSDILIKNGRVIDPFNGIDEIRDVAVDKGVLVDPRSADGWRQVIDASGCLVVPGLIDYHAHIATLVSAGGTDPTAGGFPNGITTFVDQGTTGTANYEAFRMISSGWRVRTKAFLHVCPLGLTTFTYHENQDPAVWDVPAIRRMVKQYGDQIVGLKVRTSENLVGEHKMRILESAIALADELGCRISCHATNPPVPMDELAKYFRPGDVFAHIYHMTGRNLLGPDGRVLPGMWKARERGVIFDAANGIAHFGFPAAQAALREGFLPDIISTDLTKITSYIQDQKVFALPFVMSKYIALGMSVPDIIRCVTQNPARALDMEEEIGSLSQGTCADVAVFSLVEKRQVFSDTLGNSITGGLLFKPQLTIRDGAVVYRQIDF